MRSHILRGTDYRRDVRTVRTADQFEMDAIAVSRRSFVPNSSCRPTSSRTRPHPTNRLRFAGFQKRLHLSGDRLHGGERVSVRRYSYVGIGTTKHSHDIRYGIENRYTVPIAIAATRFLIVAQPPEQTAPQRVRGGRAAVAERRLGRPHQQRRLRQGQRHLREIRRQRQPRTTDGQRRSGRRLQRHSRLVVPRWVAPLHSHPPTAPTAAYRPPTSIILNT